MSDWNGYQLCGKILPDIALENLLASLPVDEILKLREVKLSRTCVICDFFRSIFLVPGMSSMARYDFTTYFLENCSRTEWN